MTVIDLKLNEVESQIFDLEIDENGDLATVQSFDTSLLMSLFEERRADSSEVPAAHLRRGWWGNTVSDDLRHENGSKLWLLEQPRKTFENKNKAEDYARKSLQWLIDDGYVHDIAVTSEFTSEGLQLTIKLLRDNSVVDTKYYDVWEASGNL